MIARNKEDWKKKQARRDRLYAARMRRKKAQERKSCTLTEGTGVKGPVEYDDKAL